MKLSAVPLTIIILLSVSVKAFSEIKKITFELREFRDMKSLKIEIFDGSISLEKSNMNDIESKKRVSQKIENYVLLQKLLKVVWDKNPLWGAGRG